MLNFGFSKKGLGLDSPPYFVHDIPKKIFFQVIFYLLAKFHCLVAFTFDILDNMCIVIIYCPVCDAINFEIN